MSFRTEEMEEQEGTDGTEEKTSDRSDDSSRQRSPSSAATQKTPPLNFLLPLPLTQLP